MVTLSDPVQHEALANVQWDEAAARLAVAEIARDACAAFDPEQLWPTHPMDEPALSDGGHANLYFGAGGVIWALQRLVALGAAPQQMDFGAVLPTLAERNRKATESWGFGTASYLMGDAGLLLLSWQRHRDRETADALMDVVSSNLHHPACESMWGNPGTMLAAIHMAEATGESAWQHMVERAAQMLWVEMVQERGIETWLWRQDLYGRRRRYLGAGHGLAGNLYPVLRGAEFLPRERVREFCERALATLAATSLRDGAFINWLPAHDTSGLLPHSPLVQDCHGAPGVVSRLAGGAPHTPAWDALLQGAGELVWAAGPLAKGAGLANGTAGNGYAFLKLYRRTGQVHWLVRARAYAMHAIAQVARERMRFGRGRYSLWTGDLGVALFVASSIAADDAFPTLDIF